MSEVVTGVLKLTFGLIANKVRTYGAEKLQDGGLTDQKFRGLIVRELDDIKFKLDGLSRKDLSTSVSCLKQGVERLQMSFGESSESGNSSTSEVQTNGKQSRETTNEGASTLTQTKPDETSIAVEEALALANAIGKMKMESSEIFELAKESLKEAGKKAREAFHNAALSTDERILASKVRIASGILEHLERPEVAASDCLQYLRELHDLPAIQEIFSVYYDDGIKSWIKSVFEKDSRTEIVETVTVMNLILADFISKFTKRRMGVLDWPVIKSGKEVFHPIHYEKDSLPNLKEIEISPPWDRLEVGEHDNCAVNKKGDLIVYRNLERGLEKLDKTTGELQPYCRFPSKEYCFGYLRGLAVDEDDTVYLVFDCQNFGYALSVISADGTITHLCALEFLKGGKYSTRLAVTKDKNIIICTTPREEVLGGTKVWLCNCYGVLKNSFDSGVSGDVSVDVDAFASCNNEIVTFETNAYGDRRMLHIYEEDGHLKKAVQLRFSSGLPDYTCYNETTKNVIGSTHSYEGYLLLEFLSDETGELLCSCKLHETNLPYYTCFPRPICHADGALSLVFEQYVLFLQ